MRITAVLAAVLTLGSSAFAADPGLLNLVMPDAKVLAGVNVTSAKISPFGQFLMTKLPSNMPAGLSTDSVTEILMASAADPSNLTGLVLMRGTFDPEKILATLAAAPKQPAYQTSAYAGATLIVFTDPKSKANPAVAFLGTNIAVAGDEANVKAALDRSATNNAIDSALATQVTALSETEDAWLASAVSPAVMFPAPAADAAASTNPMGQFTGILSNIKSLSVGVKFGQSVPVNLNLVATSDKNAEALANVAKFIVSMISMNAGQANTQDPAAAAALKFLQTLQVTNTGSNVDLALTVPEAQLESLIGSLSAPKSDKAKRVKANE